MGIQDKSLILSEREQDILKTLDQAHREGALEVPLLVIAEAVSASPAEAEAIVERLILLGLADRLESRARVSLSGAGLRIARTLTASEVVTCELGVEPSAPIHSVTPKLSHASVDQIIYAIAQLPHAIAESTLAEQDKNRLSALVAELLAHPDLPRLLTRASQRQS